MSFLFLIELCFPYLSFGLHNILLVDDMVFSHILNFLEVLLNIPKSLKYQVFRLYLPTHISMIHVPFRLRLEFLHEHILVLCNDFVLVSLQVHLLLEHLLVLVFGSNRLKAELWTVPTNMCIYVRM